MHAFPEYVGFRLRAFKIHPRVQENYNVFNLRPKTERYCGIPSATIPYTSQDDPRSLSAFCHLHINQNPEVKAVRFIPLCASGLDSEP